MTGYLPGDPRYGLSGEALRNYYRTKAAQWAIYCWDKPGTAEIRRGLVQEQKATSKVSASASSATAISSPTTAATRSAHRSSCSSTTARRRTSSSPTSRMNKAGVYQRVEIHRWSNSFRTRSRLRRKGMQQFLCTGPKTGTPEFFREHLHAHDPTSRRMATASFSADRSARPTAPTTSAPHCCWNCPTARRRTSSGRGAVREERRI